MSAYYVVVPSRWEGDLFERDGGTVVASRGGVLSWASELGGSLHGPVRVLEVTVDEPVVHFDGVYGTAEGVIPVAELVVRDAAAFEDALRQWLEPFVENVDVPSDLDSAFAEVASEELTSEAAVGFALRRCHDALQSEDCWSASWAALRALRRIAIGYDVDPQPLEEAFEDEDEESPLTVLEERPFESKAAQWLTDLFFRVATRVEVPADSTSLSSPPTASDTSLSAPQKPWWRFWG